MSEVGRTEKPTILYRDLLLRWLDRIQEKLMGDATPANVVSAIHAVLSLYSLLPATFRREVDVEFYNKYYSKVEAKEKEEKDSQEKEEKDSQRSIPTLPEMLAYSAIYYYDEVFVFRPHLYKRINEGLESADITADELRDLSLRECAVLMARVHRAVQTITDVLNVHGLLFYEGEYYRGIVHESA